MKSGLGSIPSRLPSFSPCRRVICRQKSSRDISSAATTSVSSLTIVILIRIYDPYPFCHYWGAEPTDTPSGDDYHIVVRPDKLQRSPEPREVPAVNTGIDFLVALARIVHMERGPLNEIRTLQLFEDFLNFLTGA